MATVYRIKKSLQDGPKQRKPGSERPRFARTPNVIKAVRAKIASIRKLVKEANISEKSMRRIIKKDLHASSKNRVKRHLITDRVKELLVEEGKKMIILFSDEKLFRIDAVANSRTDRFISRRTSMFVRYRVSGMSGEILPSPEANPKVEFGRQVQTGLAKTGYGGGNFYKTFAGAGGYSEENEKVVTMLMGWRS